MIGAVGAIATAPLGDLGEFVALRIAAEAEKGFRDRILPVAPEFAEWLRRTPQKSRRGEVLEVAKRSLGLHGVSRTICKIGEAARVVVNQEMSKFASAHDFRRAFGTRWAIRVQPAVLKELMRHESIETTMKYYVGLDAFDISKLLNRQRTQDGCYRDAEWQDERRNGNANLRRAIE